MTVLVGGVGELYQGDLDLGRHAIARLAGEDLGAGVVVEELHYGAVAVTQRLEDLRPDALILVGAARRGRPPAAIERRRVRVDLSPEQLQNAVADAVTGYVTIDLVVNVAFALGALPADTVAIEVEPVLPGPADRLSPEVWDALDEVVRRVRDEVRRVTGPPSRGHDRVSPGA